MAAQKKSKLLLKPGMGIDIVFNLSSISPMIKSSIIFDSYKNRIIVAQPKVNIPSDYKYTSMHVSTLFPDETLKKKRKGYQCKIVKLVNKFKLANGTVTPAVEIEIIEPILQINVRAAFRFAPNPAYTIMGKLVYNGIEFYSGTHFKVFDISISGMGIVIPKRIKKERNPLIDIEKKAVAKTGLLLKSTEKNEQLSTLESDVQIVRTINQFNEISGFAGMKFTTLPHEGEEKLNRFIHNGQLYEIRALNQL